MIQPIKFLDPTEPVLEDANNSEPSDDSSDCTRGAISWTLGFLQLIAGVAMVSQTFL